MRQIRYLKAVTEALEQEMEHNKNVLVIGEDVRHSARGDTIGFFKKFGPDRVMDTPISEQGLHAIAIGAAMMGLRPIVEYQISEFIFFAFEQLVDQAQKFHYLSGGRIKVPITLLVTASGAIGSTSGQHSDHAYPYVLHSGMKVVIPSTPHDAKGLIVSAIRDDDPVMVFLPQFLLGVKGEVPEDLYETPMGLGEVKREGNDITVIATGHLVPIAVEVAGELEKDGLSIEVIDPRTLLPLDIEIIKNSVGKTGKVVVFDDSNRTCGFAAEVSAVLAEECFEIIKKPIIRITRADVPVPFSPAMENFMLPNKNKLANAIKKLI